MNEIYDLPEFEIGPNTEAKKIDKLSTNPELHLFVELSIAADVAPAAKKRRDLVISENNVQSMRLWLRSAYKNGNAHSYSLEISANPSLKTSGSLNPRKFWNLICRIKAQASNFLAKQSRNKSITYEGTIRYQPSLEFLRCEVRNEEHARKIATVIGSKITSLRNSVDRHVKVHLFSASPNPLVYMLGQCGDQFGIDVIYYEYQKQEKEYIPVQIAS